MGTYSALSFEEIKRIEIKLLMVTRRALEKHHLLRSPNAQRLESRSITDTMTVLLMTADVCTTAVQILSAAGCSSGALLSRFNRLLWSDMSGAPLFLGLPICIDCSSCGRLGCQVWSVWAWSGA